MEARYQGQAEGEQTLLVIYKHWFAVLPFLFVAFVMMAVSLGAIYFATSRGTDTTLASFLSVSGLGSIGAFITVLFVFAAIWVWRKNRIILTNQHLVDIDQLGLFNRKQSILNLGTIQDVSTQVKGPMQTIFGYGTIFVQTAGEKENFMFDYVPNPYTNERKIHEAHKAYRAAHGENTNDGISDFTISPRR